MKIRKGRFHRRRQGHARCAARQADRRSQAQELCPDHRSQDLHREYLPQRLWHRGHGELYGIPGELLRAVRGSGQVQRCHVGARWDGVSGDAKRRGGAESENIIIGQWMNEISSSIARLFISLNVGENTHGPLTRR